MRIRKGETAPRFIVTDISGKTIDLYEYSGHRTLISFFRSPSCPFCNLRVHELIASKEKFDAQGIKLILFFNGAKEQIMQYAGKQESPYPIIADPDLEIYKKYDVEQSFLGLLRSMFRISSIMKTMKKGFFNMKSMKERNTLPADFLIDANLKVEIPYYGKDFGDHLSIHKILNPNQ